MIMIMDFQGHGKLGKVNPNPDPRIIIITVPQ